MIDKLPYTLTSGVTATREGLWITDTEPVRFLFPSWDDFSDGRMIYWPDAADRLLITEEVQTSALVSDGVIYCSGRMVPSLAKKVRALRRIATILCDGVDDHELLYWCVTNLGGEG